MDELLRTDTSEMYGHLFGPHYDPALATLLKLLLLAAASFSKGYQGHELASVQVWPIIHSLKTGKRKIDLLEAIYVVHLLCFWIGSFLYCSSVDA